MQTFSFPPIAKANAKILILGSMPGKTSLKFNQYYAFKQNVFWKIMFDLFQTEFSEKYSIKTQLLLDNKIALWDSLKYCERESSLDSDIKNEEINDFQRFYKSHPFIKDVFFNGHASFQFYKKYVGLHQGFTYFTLPSTSPANARMSYAEKRDKWKIIKDTLNIA
jgi:hypoxanthine-DNA glycosylase